MRTSIQPTQRSGPASVVAEVRMISSPAGICRALSQASASSNSR
jgi:hypothetical protein